MLKAGDTAPDFTLEGTEGPYTLSTRSADYTILVFYVKNNTPG